MYYYERTYWKIQDVLSDIGGVANSIIFIITIINSFINKCTILTDTEKIWPMKNQQIKKKFNIDKIKQNLFARNWILFYKAK